MTLFSAPDDPWSHRTRIVIAEKAIEIEIVDVNPGKYPEDLLDLNPYHTTPTLIDRDLVLYDSRVIMEYLDERRRRVIGIEIEQILGILPGSHVDDFDLDRLFRDDDARPMTPWVIRRREQRHRCTAVR